MQEVCEYVSCSETFILSNVKHFVTACVVSSAWTQFFVEMNLKTAKLHATYYKKNKCKFKCIKHKMTELTLVRYGEQARRLIDAVARTWATLVKHQRNDKVMLMHVYLLLLLIDG